VSSRAQERAEQSEKRRGAAAGGLIGKRCAAGWLLLRGAMRCVVVAWDALRGALRCVVVARDAMRGPLRAGCVVGIIGGQITQSDAVTTC